MASSFQSAPPLPAPWGGVLPPYPMTAAAMGRQYREFIAAGWTDETLMAHGYMEKPFMSAPSSFPPVANDPPRPLAEIEAQLAERLQIAADANEVSEKARGALAETRNELRYAVQYHLARSEPVIDGGTLP